jgi:hypothetical protein
VAVFLLSGGQPRPARRGEFLYRKADRSKSGSPPLLPFQASEISGCVRRSSCNATLAISVGSSRQHSVGADEIGALSDALARKTYRLVVIAPAELCAGGDPVVDRRKRIAWTQPQCRSASSQRPRCTATGAATIPAGWRSGTPSTGPRRAIGPSSLDCWIIAARQRPGRPASQEYYFVWRERDRDDGEIGATVASDAPKTMAASPKNGSVEKTSAGNGGAKRLLLRTSAFAAAPSCTGVANVIAETRCACIPLAKVVVATTTATTDRRIYSSRVVLDQITASSL